MLKKNGLMPLKFNLREYKKYDGPKSVRDCNCKKKDEFYSESEDSSPLLYSSSASKLGGRKLKSLLTIS